MRHWPIRCRKADFNRLMDHARDLAFWEDISDPDLPHANEVWHFPPTAFVRQFRQCRWLSAKELEQVYPDTYVEKSSGQLHQATHAISAEIRERYRNILNRLLEKHSISRNPMRMSHFFGQGAEESRTLAWMEEHRSEASCNAMYAHSNGNDLPGDGYKFRGRGMKQLTGKYNYTEYWVYRGWLSRRDFTASWWTHPHPTRPSITTPEILLTVPYNAIDAGTWYWEAGPKYPSAHPVLNARKRGAKVYAIVTTEQCDGRRNGRGRTDGRTTPPARRSILARDGHGMDHKRTGPSTFLS